jgi:hypothetical protein
MIVSNRGGRNLDRAMSPMELLWPTLEAVRKRVTVLIDGGFRRGCDRGKALARFGCSGIAQRDVQHLHTAPGALRNAAHQGPPQPVIATARAACGE